MKKKNADITNNAALDLDVENHSFKISGEIVEKMVVINFHCDLALKKALEERAKFLGWKRNFLIRAYLKHGLTDPTALNYRDTK